MRIVVTRIIACLWRASKKVVSTNTVAGHYMRVCCSSRNKRTSSCWSSPFSVMTLLQSRTYCARRKAIELRGNTGVTTEATCCDLANMSVCIIRVAFLTRRVFVSRSYVHLHLNACSILMHRLAVCSNRPVPCSPPLASRV